MQLKLPLFPKTTKLINSSLGLFEKDGIVNYINGGTPIFSHAKEDRNSFQFIISHLINAGLCSPIDVHRALGVPYRNILRYVKKLREEGSEAFFKVRTRAGSCYKMNSDKLQTAQEYIDSGVNNSTVARRLGVKEGTIRYHINKGNLKKKSE